MEKKLYDFIENCALVADYRNIGTDNPRVLKIANPLNGVEYLVVCSVREPSMLSLPINTLWIMLDPSSQLFKHALRLDSADPDLTNGFYSTWTELTTYDQLFQYPQHYVDAGQMTYVHEQTGASNIWTIYHNLSKFPSVSVVDSQNRQVRGAVQYISSNVLTISFSAPFQGIAYLN